MCRTRQTEHTTSLANCTGGYWVKGLQRYALMGPIPQLCDRDEGSAEVQRKFTRCKARLFYNTLRNPRSCCVPVGLVSNATEIPFSSRFPCYFCYDRICRPKIWRV